MKNKSWDLEEAVALYNLYFESGLNSSIPDESLLDLSCRLRQRAKILGFGVSKTYRNITGLRMQIKCIEYVINNGMTGLANTSKLFYDVYDIYKSNPTKFYKILSDFNDKYR